MIATYMDQFRPRRSAALPARPSPRLGAWVPSDQRFDTRAQAVAEEQARHFRLWVYVAVDRNAVKAAQSFPQVSIVRSGRAPVRSGLTPAQRRHLRQYYTGYLQAADQEWEPAPEDHPLWELLRRVNPVDWWESFAYETYMFLQLTGGFVWWVIPNRVRTARSPQGLPAELWVIPTHWAHPVYSKTGRLTKWEITPYGNRARAFALPPEEIIYGGRKSPLDKTAPYSPLQAGAEWVLNSELIEKARHLTYRHGNLQTLVLELAPEVYENPPEELLEKVAQKFMARYGRGVEAVARPIVQPPGITARPLSLKPNEMLLDTASEQIRDFVLALYGVPRAIAGIAHDLNKASIFGANLIWCQHTIMPLQAFLAGAMTERLASRYDERLRVWFDDCSPHDAEAEREEVKLDWMMGALSPEERRRQRGYEPLQTEAGRKTYVPAGVVPLDDFSEPLEQRADAGEEEPPKKQGTDEEDETRQSQERGEPNHGPVPSDNPAARVRASLHGVGVCDDADRRRRRRIARRFDRVARRLEAQVVRAVRRFWRGVRERAIARLKDGMTDRSVPSVRDLVPPAEFEGAFNATMTPRWRAAVLQGVRFERETLGLEAEEGQAVRRQEAEPLPDIEVPVSAPLSRRIEAWLSERQVGVWRQVLETTHKAMEEAIRAGMEAGEGAEEIAQRLDEVLQDRARDTMRIARTEVIGAMNFGQQALREDEEIPYKQWIATLDRRTRQEHLAADGQIVANHEPFWIGGYAMMHPGDASYGAPPELIINCRCTATGAFRV